MGPLVSVIINNYNYERFLGDAVESALYQTYPRVEVILVDDGSTDSSREVIAAYGSRIIQVLKENGGQASAFNAGFAASRGEICCLLDADDIFLPDKVEKIVQAWRQYPHALLYYHRMQVVDARGTVKGRPWPSSLWVGYIRDKVERSGGWWPRPTTSALCFARHYLKQVLPMPEEGFRLCADAYVGDLAPFMGAVVGLPEALTLYRLHGRNYWSAPVVGYDNEIKRKAEQYIFEHKQLKKALRKMGCTATIALERHLPYLQTTHVLEGKPSFWEMTCHILFYSTLGYPARLKQLAKLILKKW